MSTTRYVLGAVFDGHLGNNRIVLPRVTGNQTRGNLHALSPVPTLAHAETRAHGEVKVCGENKVCGGAGVLLPTQTEDNARHAEDDESIVCGDDTMNPHASLSDFCVTAAQPSSSIQNFGATQFEQTLTLACSFVKSPHLECIEEFPCL